MLPQKKLNEIREHLEKSQNPLFFFDNDADGLCSFLILRRALDRGKGVAIKSFPELNKEYLRKINELNPDAIFILDKPRVSSEFINEVIERNIPIIWIDHHNVQVEEDIIKKVYYYNSSPSEEPVTYIAQSIFKRKQDIWLAMIGCIGDVYKPDFSEEFAKECPELFDNSWNAFDSIYLTEIGKIVNMLNFGLKDTTTNVLNLIRYLQKINSPHDLLEENSQTYHLHKRYKELNTMLSKLVEKAEAQQTLPNIIFFSYSGTISISSELSNKLYFRNKKKTIIVAFKRQDRANISIRGKNAKEITLKAIQDIEDSTGGGHEEACGATVPIDLLEQFKENILKIIKNPST